MRYTVIKRENDAMNVQATYQVNSVMTVRQSEYEKDIL